MKPQQEEQPFKINVLSLAIQLPAVLALSIVTS